MFKTSITSTPLTTDAANLYFTNIRGEPFGSDNSFVATLRALVAPRIKKEDSIDLIFGNSNYDANQLRNSPTDAVLSAICRKYGLDDENGIIAIHNFTSSTENNLANFRVINTTLTSRYKGYQRLDKVKAFYQKSFNVECYINPERKNVIVFVDNLDVKKLHYLQVSILAFLPWYFNPEEGVSELEMELLHSLRETSHAKYINCISRIAEAYDFRSARIRQMLAGFETVCERMECENVRSEIERIRNEASRLNDCIGELLMRENNAHIRLMGLERKLSEDEGDSEMMEYFLCNNKLYLEDIIGGDMYFAVKDYLCYFDRETANRIIENRRSFVYPHGNNRHNGISADDMCKLMKEIFVSEEPRLRIRVCAAYRFVMNGNVRANSHHNFPAFEFDNYMPNPHINEYSCMGNYSVTINKLLADRDYIGAIEQCAASCKSLNWSDSTVMESFMNTMWGGRKCCIELPDGMVVKPIDAIRWIDEQEKKKEEKNNE